MVRSMSDLERDATERERLLGYVAASRRVQRKLAVGTAVATVGAVVATVLWSSAGQLALLGVGIVAICGFWVTAAHISDWRMQIARLEARNPQLRSGRRR